jgi:hypothetical protein
MQHCSTGIRAVVMMVVVHGRAVGSSSSTGSRAAGRVAQAAEQDIPLLFTYPTMVMGVQV